MRTRVAAIILPGLLWTILLPATGLAQVVRFIDLTETAPRTELRFPPVPPKCNPSGACEVSGFVSGGVGDCGVDFRDKHILRTSLIWMEKTELKPNEWLQVDIELENVGELPVRIPVSPDLSDLQPANAAEAFSYDSLSLYLMYDAMAHLANIELYGSERFPDTLVNLQPGQNIRVHDRVQIAASSPSKLRANVAVNWVLGKNEFHSRPGGYGTMRNNICYNARPGLTVAVTFAP